MNIVSDIVSYIVLAIVAVIAVVAAWIGQPQAYVGGGVDDELIAKYLREFKSAKDGYRYETVTSSIFNDHVTKGDFVQHLGGYEKRKRLRLKIANGEEITDDDLAWLYVNDASLGEIYIELDGYNHDARVAFEYNGPLHYGKRPNEKDIDYQKRRQNDQTKRQLLSDHDISLLIIPYTVTNIDCKARGLRGDDCLRENIKQLLRYIRSRLFDLKMLKKGEWMGPNQPHGYMAPIGEPYTDVDLRTQVQVDRGTGKITKTTVDAATLAELDKAKADEDTWETAGSGKSTPKNQRKIYNKR
jgi:hypothetical protein